YGWNAAGVLYRGISHDYSRLFPRNSWARFLYSHTVTGRNHLLVVSLGHYYFPADLLKWTTAPADHLLAPGRFQLDRCPSSSTHLGGDPDLYRSGLFPQWRPECPDQRRTGGRTSGSKCQMA